MCASAGMSSRNLHMWSSDYSTLGNTGNFVTNSSDYSILGNAGNFVTNSSDYSTLGNAGNFVTNSSDYSTLGNAGNFVTNNSDYSTLGNAGNFVTNNSDYSTLGNAGNFVTNNSDYSTLGNTGNFVTNVTDPTTPSQNNQHDLPPWEGDDNLVSPQQRDLATLVLKCGLQNAVMFFGIPGNALNLAVFAKQGLRDRINVLLFSLAVADLMNLVTRLLQSLTCFMNTVDSANWEVIITPQGFHLNRYANFVSGMLIVTMAVDRCLSVTLPLKASRILSFRRMLTVVLVLYIALFALYTPSFLLSKVSWRFDPQTNRSMAYIEENYPLAAAIPVIVGTIFIVKPVSIAVVIICSSVTISILRKAAKKRKAMRESQSAASQSETRVTKMLLFLCVTYVVCVIPDVIGAFTAYFVPEFMLYRKHHNLFVVCFDVFFLFSCLNSTVNVFAYLALSTRFRSTLGEIIPCFAKLFTARWRSGRKHEEILETTMQSSVSTVSSTIP